MLRCEKTRCELVGDGKSRQAGKGAETEANGNGGLVVGTIFSLSKVFTATACSVCSYGVLLAGGEKSLFYWLRDLLHLQKEVLIGLWFSDSFLRFVRRVRKFFFPLQFPVVLSYCPNNAVRSTISVD